jgi:hypothetical protein
MTGFRVFLLLCACVLSGCSFPAWRDRAMADLMAGRIRPPGPSTGTGTPSQTIEFYDRSGQHLGYGVSRGGAVDVYGADGSRKGFAR